MNRSDFDFVDDPTVAINDEGFVGIAWADQSRHDIFFQVYGPSPRRPAALARTRGESGSGRAGGPAGTKRLAEPVNVSKSPRIFSWLPRLVIGPGDANDAYLLWQEIVFSPGGTHGGEAFFARSTDGGRTFGQPINLSNSIAGDGKGRLTRRFWHNGSLDLGQGPEGHLYAAWTEYQGKLWFSRSTDGGVSFSDPLHVAGDKQAPARGPSLAVDAEGGTVYLAWTVGEDAAADIRFAKSVDQGRSFGEPRIVFLSGGHADAPKIAVDGKGTVHLVYAESPAGPFKRYHIRYTRSTDGGRAFEEPREISRPRTVRLQSMSFPALSLDGEDNIYVLWELFPDRGHRSQGLGFTHSSDGGRTFASPSVIPGTMDPALGVNGSQQGLLMRKLAVNRAGALAVVNSTFKKNQSSRIWLYRGHAAGR